MPQHMIFPAPREVVLQERDPAPLEPGEVRVATTLSLISAGTELRCWTGDFAPGTHWARYVRYPMGPGYSSVGRVTETTEESLRPVGARVFARRPHAGELRLPIEAAVPIPDDVPDEVAAWTALAMVGGMGFRAGDVTLGTTVAILGAGPIGQMALRWCAAAGARVAVLDPAEPRLAYARAGGAEATFALGAEQAVEPLRDLFGALPDVVFDTTGAAPVFPQALALPRDFGTLVLLGDAGDPSEQRLTGDIVTRGVRVIGAHMVHEDPHGLRGPAWTEATIAAHFYRLWRAGRFPIEGLVTSRHDPRDAATVYARIESRDPGTMGLLFDWTVAT